MNNFILINVKSLEDLKIGDLVTIDDHLYSHHNKDWTADLKDTLKVSNIAGNLVYLRTINGYMARNGKFHWNASLYEFLRVGIIVTREIPDTYNYKLKSRFDLILE